MGSGEELRSLLLLVLSLLPLLLMGVTTAPDGTATFVGCSVSAERSNVIVVSVTVRGADVACVAARDIFWLLVVLVLVDLQVIANA